MRSSRLFFRLTWALLLTLPATAGDKKPVAPQPASNLHFTVLKDDNNKPVRNASVVLHTVGKNGSQAKGGFQIKTDSEGKAETEGLPYGTLRVQVLAPGFQTYGEDYNIDQPEMKIEIRLKRPTDQLTVYDSGKPQTAPATAPPSPEPH
jgi:hypothetical protein